MSNSSTSISWLCGIWIGTHMNLTLLISSFLFNIRRPIAMMYTKVSPRHSLDTFCKTERVFHYKGVVFLVRYNSNRRFHTGSYWVWGGLQCEVAAGVTWVQERLSNSRKTWLKTNTLRKSFNYFIIIRCFEKWGQVLSIYFSLAVVTNNSGCFWRARTFSKDAMESNSLTEEFFKEDNLWWCLRTLD